MYLETHNLQAIYILVHAYLLQSYQQTIKKTIIITLYLNATISHNHLAKQSV